MVCVSLHPTTDWVSGSISRVSSHRYCPGNKASHDLYEVALHIPFSCEWTKINFVLNSTKKYNCTTIVAINFSMAK